MTEQTKAPERIWAWPDDVENGFMAASLPDNPPTKEYAGGSHIDYVRADLAAEQVREAYERGLEDAANEVGEHLSTPEDVLWAEDAADRILALKSNDTNHKWR